MPLTKKFHLQLRKVSLCFVVLAAAAVSFATRAESLSIDGMSIGQSHADVVSAHPGIHCPAPIPGEIRECFYRRTDGYVPTLATVAGQPANTWLMHFADGKLAHLNVLFPRASLDAVYNNVLGKVGKPVHFQKDTKGSLIAIWGDDNVGLALSESFTPDQSALTLIRAGFDWRAAMKKKQ